MRHAYAIGFLITANLLVFGQTATFDFVAFDDQTYLLDNPQFNDGLTLDNIHWSFTTGYFANWHPITWLSFFLDYELYGLDARGYHVTNTVIHILASILLYLALFTMTRRRAESLIVAILFAVHPQHVQSVAWISERKDVLSAFFLGLILLTYRQYTLTKTPAWYGATLLLYALGLMSKSMLVTLPCVLLLLDYWPLGRLADRKQIRRAILEKIPLLAMAAGSSIVTYMCQAKWGVIASLATVDLGARFANALLAYGIYLLRTLYPVNLTFYYPLVISEIPYAMAALSAIVLAAISLLVWRFRKDSPALLVGWLWYLGTLLPVSGLIHIGGHSSADRYTYIPLIGIFIALAYTVHPWLQKNHLRRKLTLYIYSALLVACLFISFKETYFWRDTATLAGRSILVRPDNRFAYQMLGDLHFMLSEMDKAELFYEEYRLLDPDSVDVQLHLAAVFQAQGRIDESEKILLACIDANPYNAMARFSMGLSMDTQNRTAEALKWYEEALELEDGEPRIYNHYGILLAKNGTLELALEQFDAALEIDPNNPDTHYHKATALFFHKKDQEALESVQKCLQIDPKYPPAHPLLDAIRTQIAQEK